MPINKVVKGDLIKMAKQGNFDVIAHGCNCFCTMGAGIAKRIKEEFPSAYIADCQTVKGDKSKLGQFTMVVINDYLDVWNMYTQYNYGGKNPISYYGITRSFLQLNDFYKGCGVRIGIPKIGSGLAGGDWGIIEEIINGCTPDIDITLVEYDGGR